MSQSILYDILDKTHEEMKNRFKKNNDEQQAKRLERFFNAVIYNGSKKGLRGLLNSQLVDAIRLNNPNIGKQFMIKGTNNYYSGQIGEEAFGNLILAILNQLDSKKSHNNISVNSILSGKELVQTVERIGEDSIQAAKKAIDKENIQLQGSFYAPTQQKTDLNTNTIIQSYDLTSEAKELLALTASVKNYDAKAQKINLGHRHILKILRSTLSGLNVPLSVQEQKYLNNRKRMTIKQYDDKEDKIKQKVAAHLSHLQYAYELIGIGQMKKEDLSQPADYPRFLFINLQGNRIIVRSTIALINQMFSSQKNHLSIIDGSYLKI